MPLSKDKKKEYFIKMKTMLDTYTKMFVVNVDNVGSKQMNDTRRAMRGKAEILMGKNTLMRKILADYMEENPTSHWGKMEPLMSLNVGFVFTNSDLVPIRDLILANRMPAPAKVNSIAPVDVVIAAGPTGCDPGQTAFFQVLQIPTKIVKGQIEITSPVSIIKTGDKVGSSEAAILTKLNMKPFSYGLKINTVMDNGSIFSVDVLSIDEAFLARKFSWACSRLAAISLQIGFPTQASVAHTMNNAFKSLVAVTINLDTYTFDKAAEYKKLL